MGWEEGRWNGKRGERGGGGRGEISERDEMCERRGDDSQRRGTYASVGLPICCR